MGLQMWDSCMSAIVYGGEADQAQKRFEEWCRSSPEGEDPVETQIKKIVGTRFINQMLTESGSQPPDWPEISRRFADTLSATDVDEFEQGYWVDVNQAVPCGKLSFDIQSLKRDLPEEIRSGLNWSAEKTFLFVVSILTPCEERPQDIEFEHDANYPGDTNDEKPKDMKPDLDRAVDTLPELREKQAAALIEARNSVVAAWLWRKFSAGTPLASNEIQVGPCLVFIPAE